MLSLLKRMPYSGITVHGFRSTFRDWVAECTDYPDSLAEEALAHIITSRTIAAYRRRDQLERRRFMMEDWGAYCSSGRMLEESMAPVMPQTFAAKIDAACVLETAALRAGWVRTRLVSRVRACVVGMSLDPDAMQAEFGDIWRHRYHV
ncbi:hypothetical protein [Burkholderia cepacia]|uniref:hypothetical protein n=1 Tax=Burkholderia cepacia TaxID=292 RepID=UPI002ED84D29